MSSPFVAEIRMWACNFAPTGWAMCNGQLLPLSQNMALFSILGTFYGGDGKSTFALPNLQGSVAIGQGDGAGPLARDQGHQQGESRDSSSSEIKWAILISGRFVFIEESCQIYPRCPINHCW